VHVSCHARSPLRSASFVIFRFLVRECIHVMILCCRVHSMHMFTHAHISYMAKGGHCDQRSSEAKDHWQPRYHTARCHPSTKQTTWCYTTRPQPREATFDQKIPRFGNSVTSVFSQARNSRRVTGLVHCYTLGQVTFCIPGLRGHSGYSKNTKIAISGKRVCFRK